ncbi:MAG: electron transfer flavoprotein subunit beta/FixA family protein [Acidimicrobiia bacterium]|nr:electron transfer flavoprotein subunit beta/FixA family protein [Acidimicrobiia bacterium]
MHVVVCVKQVWDPEFPSVSFKIDEEVGEVIPVPGLSQVVSPYDEQAVEAALRLRDAGAKLKITILCYGPSSAEHTIRGVLALGADEGILVADEAAEWSDGASTATILAAAIRKIGNCDLVLTGRQAADTDAGVVGCGLAAILDLPAITLAKEIQISDRKIRIVRVLADHHETVEAPLPALVTVTHELGKSRYASLKETMRARRKPMACWTVTELGLAGSATPAARVVRKKLFIPRRDQSCEFISGATTQDLAAKLAQRLYQEGLF